jgi:hypothetical protein
MQTYDLTLDDGYDIEDREEDERERITKIEDQGGGVYLVNAYDFDGDPVSHCIKVDTDVVQTHKQITRHPDEQRFLIKQFVISELYRILNGEDEDEDDY